MGAGKGSIDHYATPVKAGQVIIEVGGEIEYFEVLTKFYCNLSTCYRSLIF